jgi:4,5-DOPA dioxygenase extradiol
MRLPVLFAGHGSPMNALADNDFTRTLKEWGRRLPRPEAVLAVSAHWYGAGLKVLTAGTPRTIHDFGGFPRALHEVNDPAPGHPALAREALRLLAPEGAQADESWGLDHGTWSVLLHLFPRADVPVFQVSVDARRPAESHWSLGERLAPLRERGVLIVGSGDVVHNLAELGPREAPPQDWALRFDEDVKAALSRRDRAALVSGAAPSRAVPTPDHYLPLLTAAGAGGADPLSFPIEGFEHGAISLRAAQWG